MNQQCVVRSLRDTIHDHGHKNVELEFRLGRIVNEQYVTGVTKATFDALLRHLEKSPAFSKNEKTTLEKLNGTDARFIIENGDEAGGRWCYKKKVCTETAPGKENVPRASVALEGHDHAPPPPGSPPFKYHRLKKRTSFVHECWTVDMTRVTSNLPGQFDNDEEMYEVEVELTGVDAFFVYTLEYLVEWGLHLLNELTSL
jgi:hypothetical protein